MLSFVKSNKIKGMFFLLMLFSIFSANADVNGTGWIDPKKIKYISYMLAAPKGLSKSAFGHSYLLFKSDVYVSPEDQAIEFFASVNPAELNYIRGLGVFSYDRKVVLEKFNIIKKDITIFQNRDLEIYDLKLSAYQRAEIISKINDVLNKGKMGHYSFVSSNCAGAVSDILNGIGLRISGLSAKIPTQLRDVLREKALIGRMVRFESNENIRSDAIRKYWSSLESIRIPKFYRSLDKMFNDQGEMLKLFSLLLASQYKMASNNPNDIEAFVRSYWLTLKAVMKKQFNNMIALPVGSVRLNIKNKDRPFSEYIVRHTNIDCSEVECWLNVTFSHNDERNDFLNSKYPLKELQVKGDEVYFGNLLLGVRLGGKTAFSENATLLFAATPVITKYSVEGVDILDIGLIIEKNLTETYQKKTLRWDRDIIWQTNTDVFHPMCFTILHLQQAMFERAIFAPQLPMLGKQENINILKSLLTGAIVVVPGFKNAYDFSKAIDKKDFVNEIYPIQKKNYDGILNGIDQWLNLSEMQFNDLKAMSLTTHNLNISVPVIFRRNNKSTQIVSHSILITDMIDEGEFYRISGYDPNYTYAVDLGTINKKTLLMHTKSYGEVNLFIGKADLSKSLFSLQLINSSGVRDLLIQQASKLNRFSISADEILQLQ
ncbi:MAG: lipoprotein N-acyltransferase Lnb domain-containing protein [Bdellovibrio sp.]